MSASVGTPVSVKQCAALMIHQGLITTALHQGMPGAVMRTTPEYSLSESMAPR